MSTGGGRARRTLGVLAVLAAGLALGAAPAAAHDALVGTSPADGSTLTVAPDRVVLTFAEPALTLGTQVAVTGPDGTDVAQGDVQIVGSTVVQQLGATRPAGTYTVDWRVTSSDGHPVSGAFTFTASSPTPAVPSASPPAPAGSPSPVPSEAAPTPAASTAAVLPGPVPPGAPPAGGRTAVGVLVLVLVVLGLVVVRVGRARSLRAAHAAAAGPGGADGHAGGA